MRKKFWFLIVIVLLIIIGGFFYFWIPNHQSNSSPNPPTLFGKDDYKVEERDDGKYIVVDKVGLTAKVPDNWDIKFEGNDYPEPEYSIDLYSIDVATTTNYILTDGCIISIMVINTEKEYEETKRNIEILEKNPEKKNEILYNDYILFTDIDTIKINRYSGIKLIFTDSPTMGGGNSIRIPIKNKNLLSSSISFSLDYKNKCSLVWEEFIKNLKIK